MKIDMNAIRIDGGTQIRKSLNQNKVKEYAELMKDGVEFAPIYVIHDGSDYWLASGFHRYFATKSLDKKEIEATVGEGTNDDAFIFALQSNKHGLPLTSEDIHFCVEKALKHDVTGKWSSSQIARHVGTSVMTVSRIRKKLFEQPKEITYVRQGKTLTMVNKAAKEKPPEIPKAPPATPSEEMVYELTDTIESLEEQLNQAKDVIASQRWDATEIEVLDIHETVKQLREQIRILEIDNKALRDSRDMFQARNAELIKTVNSLKKKLK